MMNAGLSEVVELRLQELFIRNEYAPSTLKTTLIKCKLCSVGELSERPDCECGSRASIYTRRRWR